MYLARRHSTNGKQQFHRIFIHVQVFAFVFESVEIRALNFLPLFHQLLAIPGKFKISIQKPKSPFAFPVIYGIFSISIKYFIKSDLQKQQQQFNE